MRQAVFYLLSGLCIATAALAQNDDSSKNQRAAPPAKWDSRVTDTFFPDARKALTGERPNYGAAAAKTTSGQVPPATPAATGGFAWSKLISADALQDEIKSLAPQLADDVKTQQGFVGGGSKKSRKTLSLLAAAFAIINEFDGEVKWKPQAAAARDQFARTGFNAKAATEQTFREAKQRSDELASLLRGEKVPAPTTVEAKNEWTKIANRAPLMSRLELAQRDRISPWTANAGAFKKNSSALRHEAEIVAALAEVISRPGFDYADDQSYRDYAKSLQQSALELREAVQNDNYAVARTAAGTLSKACNSCHGDFR